MPTNRQIASDISDYLKSNNIDERLSFRFLISELRESAQNFIKQDADNRRIFKQDSLWKSIPCGIELEEVPLIECTFDIQDCQTIMRSKEKIPKTYVTVYGSLLRISNIDGSGNYIQTTPEGYKEQNNREFKDKRNKYFWIIDDYLYIPDAYLEAVRVNGFFKEDSYLKVGKCKKGNCLKPLDMEFNCPDYLVKIVKDSVKQQLLQAFGRRIDTKPNLDQNEI